MKGRQGPYRWRLEQRGNIVTGTYTPLNAIINGTVDNSGRLSFTWVEHNTRNAPSASGRGYLVLVTPNEWQGRWWPGNSLVDPTPNQPNTWHATRSSTPPVQTPPNLRYPLPRLRKP